MKVTVTKKSKTVMKVHDPLNPIMRFKIDPRANRLSPIKAKFQTNLKVLKVENYHKAFALQPPKTGLRLSKIGVEDLYLQTKSP